MPIFALRQIVNVLAPADNEDLIGFALYLAAQNHFVNFLGQTGLAFGYDACNAAVAINPHADYDGLAAAGANFSALYGTSRLFAGLDPDFNQIHVPAPGRPFSSSAHGEHAEQTAIRLVDGSGGVMTFLNHGGHFHLYVDLNPCPGCTNWLTNDPRQWFVHYRANLAVQAPLVREKKDFRKRRFGRIAERKHGIQKRRVTGNRRGQPKRVR